MDVDAIDQVSLVFRADGKTYAVNMSKVNKALLFGMLPTMMEGPMAAVRLSDELAGTENRIATERRRYNEVVQEYNTLTKSFPAVITAKALGFGEQKYFEAPEAAKQVPQVKF